MRTSSVCLRQRHARADRPRAMPGQQRLDLRRRHGVTAGAVVEDAELVLHLLRTVDRDGDADPLFSEELDHVRPQQRRVGRQAEVDLLAGFGGAPARVGDRRLEDREIHQRLAAEERDVRVRVVARFAQRELDALARGLLAHELRLLAVLGIDDLVLAVLVAIGAGQVALVGDVDHQRLQRDRLQRNDLRHRLRRDAVSASARTRCSSAIVSETSTASNRSASSRVMSSAGPRTGRQRIEDRARTVVEREHRGTRHQVQEPAAGGLERMKFS